MICCWLKVLYFFRGLDETSFIVNMLIKIGFDMAPFLLVLAVVLIAFAASFFLLLRTGAGAGARGPCRGQVDRAGGRAGGAKFYQFG